MQPNVTGRTGMLRDAIFDGFVVPEKEPAFEVNFRPLTSFETNYTFLYKHNSSDVTGYDVRSS